jgi:Divergent InlB B-repeat domain
MSVLASPSARHARWTAVSIVLVLVVSALALAAVPAASSATTNAASRSATPAGAASSAGRVLAGSTAGAATGVELAPHPAGGGVASGRGAFFDNTNLSLPGTGQSGCWPPITPFPTLACMNQTFDPSINITAGGTIGVAVTAFTNVSACGNVSGVTSTMLVNVGFQSSANGGASWSPLSFLGNENCSAALPLEDAWQPTLTSLANGTFVLAYIEFNLSACHSSFIFLCDTPAPPRAFPYYEPNSALVVQESYNGGSTWTAPDVVNETYNATAGAGLCGLDTGAPLYRPWITADGSSVYLAYENISAADTCSPSSPYTSSVHLTVSTNGGATWGTPVTFPTQGDSGVPVAGSATNFSVNPYVLAAPNGQVYVAYATGLEGPSSYCQGTQCATTPPWTQDVVVANATGGTGTWTVHDAAVDEPFNATGDAPYPGQTPFEGLRPQLGYDGATHALTLVYNSQLLGTYCYTVPVGTAPCVANATTDDVVVQNSTNGGLNWSTPEVVGNLVDPNRGVANAEELPALAIDPNGTISVAFALFNDTACTTVPLPTCGAWEQVVVNSSNGGATWGSATELSPYTWTSLDSAYLGEYETATVAPSGAPYFAWTNAPCPAPAPTTCNFASLGGPGPATGVVVSTPFDGVGVTLTFTESRLPSSLTWSVDLLGNLRSASGGTSLSISGVPTTQPMLWSVPWINVTAGVAWEALAAPTNPAPPATFAGNTTLAFVFSQSIEVTIGLNPPLPSIDLTPGFDSATYSMSPLPEITWVPSNTTLNLTVAPQPISCVSGCDYENLTWTSWTGTGNGSVSTPGLNLTVTARNTPITETANFLDLGPCQGASGVLTCYGPYGYPLSLVETGLPSGTAWSATVVANGSANGTYVATSTGPWLNVTIGQDAASFTLWTVPDGTTGLAWVPSSSPSSPVQEPVQNLVSVTYTLENPANATFVANLTATGLPNGTAWSAEVGTTSYAVPDGSLDLPVRGGSETTLNGSIVYTEDGVAYYVDAVSVLTDVMGSTWQNTTNLATPFWFNGSAQVVLSYLPMYWLTVAGSTGGTVGPASEWVVPGTTVTIVATASPGYQFLDWTGAGSGSSTLGQEHQTAINITPNGTVNELATFRATPPPVWTVNVTALGLPTGRNFTFAFGNETLSTSGPRAAVAVESGTYVFAPATVYTAGTNDTRWVPTSWSDSFGPGEGPLLIAGNGSVTVNFTTDYTLTVAAGADGSVGPASLLGTTWQANGTGVSLTASPDAHYGFAGWNASGPGTAPSASATTAVTVLGPTSETATFVFVASPPARTYTLNVTETGLPAGTVWFLATAPGTSSISGTTDSLVLTGLNGSYTLTVPTVYLGAGTRYVPNSTAPLTVAADRSTSVAFSTEYAVSIAAGQGGAASGAGTSWVAAGASVSLSATPSTGFEFLYWNGSGPSGATPYSGTAPSGTVTVTGPTNETATFGPLPTTHTAGSSTAGEAPAVGILVALLVVGLVVGLLFGRGRGGRPSTPPESSGGAAGEGPSGPADDADGPSAGPG